MARFAAGDTTDNELNEARSLLAACAQCAALAADLRVLPSALRQAPAPRRPRDFRLTVEQAERLRGSRLERMPRGLAGTGWTTLRPVAGVALSLGLVLAVVGALPVGLPAGEEADTFSAPRTEKVDMPVTQAPAQEFAPGAGVPSDESEPAINGGPEAEATPALGEDPFSEIYLEQMEPSDGDERVAKDDLAAPTRDWMIYAGLALAAAALGLLSLVWFARRRFADPLLR